MIRFRLGRQWKHDGAGPATDSFGLELDGVELLAGASDEPLGPVVEGLIHAVQRLFMGDRFAQLSLTEARLEVVFLRAKDAVDLRIASFGRPTRVIRPQVEVGLEELRRAAIYCGRGWLSDLGKKDAKTKALAKALTTLERMSLKPLLAPAHEAGFSYQKSAPAGGVGFHLQDAEDFLLSYKRAQGAALGPLLAPGDVSFALGRTQKTIPSPALFLNVFDLCRQATDWVRAIERREKPGKLVMGPGAQTAVDDPHTVAQRLFDVGLELVAALTHRNPLLVHNDYVTELAADCRKGYSALRKTPPPMPTRAAPAKKKKAAQKPLPTQGKLRKLRFQRLWTQRDEGGFGPATLILNATGVTAVSQRALSVYSADGEVRVHRQTPLGVAGAADGSAVVAEPTRLVGFRGLQTQACWMRPYDGAALESGPLLIENGLWIAHRHQGAFFAAEHLTGRERWRITPSSTQRAFLTLHGNRIAVASSSGYFYGLDIDDALVRFRERASKPFSSPAVGWGKRVAAVAGDSHASELLALDAETGELAFQTPIPLRTPGAPTALGQRLYLTGADGAGRVLCCVGNNGQVLWKKALPLPDEPVVLVTHGGGVIATARSGACALVTPKGEIEWRLGAGGEPLEHAIAPVIARNILFVPGETIRAVDPKSGRVLSDVKVGVGLTDLRVSAKLTLYVSLDNGAVEAYGLATQLSVVDRA